MQQMGVFNVVNIIDNIHIMYWDPSIHNINDTSVVMVMGRVE